MLQLLFPKRATVHPTIIFDIILTLCYTLLMVRFVLRLPKELHMRIKEIAREAERSMNGQILFILKKWVEEHDEKV